MGTFYLLEFQGSGTWGTEGFWEGRWRCYNNGRQVRLFLVPSLISHFLTTPTQLAVYSRHISQPFLPIHPTQATPIHPNSPIPPHPTTTQSLHPTTFWLSHYTPTQPHHPILSHPILVPSESVFPTSLYPTPVNFLNTLYLTHSIPLQTIIFYSVLFRFIPPPIPVHPNSFALSHPNTSQFTLDPTTTHSFLLHLSPSQILLFLQSHLHDIPFHLLPSHLPLGRSSHFLTYTGYDHSSCHMKLHEKSQRTPEI